MADITISAGVSSSGINVNVGDNLIIMSGGTATNTTEAGGNVVVNDGGTADFVANTISGYTVDNHIMTVHSKTKALENTFGWGGFLRVYEGGYASGNLTSASWAGIEVFNGGLVTGGTMTVSSGGITVNSGGTLEDMLFTGISYYSVASALINVLEGGTVKGTTVHAALNVNSGAVASNTLMTGGVMNVAGTADTVTAEGGALNINGGSVGTAVFTNANVNVNTSGTLDSLDITSGTITVQDSSLLKSVTLQERTTMNMLTGATVGGTVEVGFYNTLNVSSGCEAVTVLENGGAVNVADGAEINFIENTISGSTVDNHIMTVHSKTKALENTFGWGGFLRVYEGGYASGNLTSASWAGIEVFNGGLVTGGTMTVSSGGITVNSGGTLEDMLFTGISYYSVASALINVLEGGTVKGTTVHAALNVNSGAVASNTLMTGGVTNVAGTATGMEVQNGTVNVNSGGVLTGEVRISGGAVNVSSGGAFLIDLTEVAPRTAAIVSGAGRIGGTKVLTVKISDTQAAGKYLLSAEADGFNGSISVVNGAGEELGTLTVDGSATIGGTDCHLVVSRHTMKFFYGIDVIPSDVYVDASWSEEETGTTVTVDGGTATIGFDAFATGAAAAAAVDEDDGILYIESGTTVSFPGTTREVIVSSGAGLDVPSGSTVGLMTVQNGGVATMFAGGSASAVDVASGGGFEMSGGLLTSANVAAGGRMTVTDGAKVQSLIAESKSILTLAVTPETEIAGTVGEEVFTIGGGAAANCRINASCTLELGNGATAYDTVAVGASALVRADSGGTAVRTTVGAGATAAAAAGGTLNGVNLEAGATLELASGGKLTGRAALAAGASYKIEAGAIVDFDISGLTSPSMDLLVNDVSYLLGEADFTLTVSGSQECGTYYFAGGAADFEGTISVVDTAGTGLGTLAAGETVQIGEVYYTLRLTDGLLGVTIAEPDTITTRRSDIDGNGISDVMFAWSGYNYQHGYWMNGSDQWLSANSPHPADWDNLGCHDMTGNGKADSVLVGNVVINDVKGAYIGYYLNAYDDPDGSTWVNIGYLTNEDNIDWKNTVGNLTGNEAGVNSIVWFAPELSALGAWVDGTDEWGGIAVDDLDETWTLIGCGDFNGDGKESILMAQNGGEQYFAIDIDGTKTSMGNADWSSGWEVRAIGDFAGDGKDDLVLFHKETGSMVLLADGNLDDYKSIGQLDANDWFVVGAGDYNGDQQDDLLVRQYSTGMLGYYTSGDTTQWQVLGYGVDMQWTVIA